MRRFIIALRLMAVAALTIANFMLRLFGLQDYMLFAGLGLVSYGLSLVYLPAAYIAPGAVLAAVSISISFRGSK